MVRQKSSQKIKLYRLSLIENSTHKTIRTIRFSRLAFYITAAAAAVALVLLIYCVIAFTPLRKSIPGYPDAHSKKVSLENAIKIDSLENAILRWNLYVTNLRNVLTGQSSVSIDSLISTSGSTSYLSMKSIAELSKQDSILRETVRREEQFGVSANASKQLPIEGMHFFSPLKGIIATDFDSVLHPGLDISASSGAIVSSVLDGSVIQQLRTEQDGIILIIQHRDDVISIYSMLDKTLVGVGDSVKAGSPIAIVGAAAGSPDKHLLHFELWHRGEALNPLKYISL